VKSLCKKHKEINAICGYYEEWQCRRREKLMCVSSRGGRGEVVARDWEVVEEVKIEA
jgi:hypothetical protein